LRPRDKYRTIFDQNYVQFNCRIPGSGSGSTLTPTGGSESRSALKTNADPPQHTGTKIPIHLADPVAEKDKIQSGRDAGKNDEPQREIGAQLRHPDGVEGVLQLDAPLAHVEDEEAEAAEQDHGEVAPIGGQPVRLAHSYI
jgi:hypothetical protein